jgi:hypothetical protein
MKFNQHLKEELMETVTATKEKKYYWTYQTAAGFHVSDYVRLTEEEAEEKYGDSLRDKLPWSELLVD